MPPWRILLQQSEFRNMTMTTINPFADVDAKSAVGSSALRPRAGGNGRHSGKMPELFPDVLADLALSKNVALEAVSALSALEKSASHDDKAGAEDVKKDALPEENIRQPAISADVNQYLQNLGALADHRAEAGEAVGPPALVAELPATVASRIEVIVDNRQADGDGHGVAPGLGGVDIRNSQFSTRFLEMKPVNPQEAGKNNVMNPQVTSRFHGMKPVDPREAGKNNVMNPQITSRFHGMKPADPQEAGENNVMNPQISSRFHDMKPADPQEAGKNNVMNPQISSRLDDANPDDANPANSGEQGRNNTRYSQIPSRPQDMRPASPQEQGTEMAGPPNVLSGEPSKPEHMPERKEAHQAKPADVEVHVIKVETSFSPAISSGFVAQFAKAITESLDGPTQNPIVIVENPVLDPRRDLVKSIQIQLHPDDLGTVKVAMHLRGDDLRLQIEVSSKKVEVLLLNDHQVLKDILGQAGYEITDASISITFNPSDLNPPQRSAAASDSQQGALAGQGYRQNPGASEENQSQFQKARGSHASAAEFENGQEAKLPAAGSRRGNGVFV
jgi:flagellar hook-length control protein FliK